jgi:AcrR family transcriptional regulator
MNQPLDPGAIARQPTQQRSKARFDRVLEAAETLLLDVGLSGFSIPVLAERLGYTRGSVYAFFPTHYAILNELVVRYLVELETVFYSRADELVLMPWRDAVGAVVNLAADFHNSHPAARLLILGGAATDDSYRAQEMTIKRLGDLARAVWARNGVKLPKGPPDITTLATEIATAVMRRSFFEHGEITRPYREAAVRAMLAFLAEYLERPASRNKGRAK